MYLPWVSCWVSSSSDRALPDLEGRNRRKSCGGDVSGFANPVRPFPRLLFVVDVEVVYGRRTTRTSAKRREVEAIWRTIGDYSRGMSMCPSLSFPYPWSLRIRSSTALCRCSRSKTSWLAVWQFTEHSQRTTERLLDERLPLESTRLRGESPRRRLLV